MAYQIIDGVPHRMRRGKWVPIPPEWQGRVTSRQTIRERRAEAAVRNQKKVRRPAGLKDVAPEAGEWNEV